MSRSIQSTMYIVMLLCIVAMAAAQEMTDIGRRSSESDDKAVTSASGVPPRTRMSGANMLRLLYGTTEERIEGLAETILQGIPETAQRLKAEELFKSRPVTKEAVKWIVNSIAISRGRYKWEPLALLAAIYDAKTNAEVKALIMGEYDRTYSRVVALTDGRDAAGTGTWKTREALWSAVLTSLENFGHEDLLTQKFWSAVVAENYRVDSILFVYASPRVLERLERTLRDMQQEDPMREEVEQLRDKVRLVVKYPELKTLKARFLWQVLGDLSQVSDEQQKAWLVQRMKVVRLQMDKEARLVGKAATTKPANEPARATRPAAWRGQ